MDAWSSDIEDDANRIYEQTDWHKWGPAVQTALTEVDHTATPGLEES